MKPEDSNVMPQCPYCGRIAPVYSTKDADLRFECRDCGKQFDISKDRYVLEGKA